MPAQSSPEFPKSLEYVSANRLAVRFRRRKCLGATPKSNRRFSPIRLIGVVCYNNRRNFRTTYRSRGPRATVMYNTTPFRKQPLVRDVRLHSRCPITSLACRVCPQPAWIIARCFTFLIASIKIFGRLTSIGASHRLRM